MCNSMQMLYYQAPLSALFVACIIPFFEPVFAKGGIFGTEWSLAEVVRITVMCSSTLNVLRFYDL